MSPNMGISSTSDVVHLMELRGNDLDSPSIDAKLHFKQLEWMYASIPRKYPALVNTKRVLLQFKHHITQTTWNELLEFEGIEPMTPLAPLHYYCSDPQLTSCICKGSSTQKRRKL